MASDPLHLMGQITLLAGGAFLVFAALHDVAARTIPNWTSLGLAILGAVLRWQDGQLVAGLALGALVFLVSTFCWTRGWIGGGDVKLLGAAAIFVPPGHVGDMLVSIALAGGVVGLIYLASRHMVSRDPGPRGKRPDGLLARIRRAERWRVLRGGSLPYASAIAAGTIFVIVAG
jgi:prepilin peptidase CpaA